MIWLTIVALVVAWFPTKYLAQKWKRGLLAPIAAVIGIICSFVCTFAVGFAISLVSPMEVNGQLFLDTISRCSLFLLISPFAAWWGWRSARNTKGVE